MCKHRKKVKLTLFLLTQNIFLDKCTHLRNSLHRKKKKFRKINAFRISFLN